jgi:uncharacterized protein (UPF0276 family)
MLPLHRGVGVGWRPELASDLLRAPGTVDFVEVVAETCFVQPAARREARAVAELWPVVPHGVKLSLGSATGIDLDKARKLGALARELEAPMISEHVALTRGGRREIGHLTALPFTREAVAVLARNVAAARRVLPDVPLLLENIAWTFRWPEDAMPEGDFYQEVVNATGCDLLLDVANLYANARNSGADPEEALLSYPLDRVAMVHVAGGAQEDGFYEDTHAHSVPDAVFDLLEQLLERTGPRPIVLERDAQFPPFAEVRAEVGRLRDIAARPAVDRVRPEGRSRPRSASAVTFVAGTESLAERQARVADWLTGDLPNAAATLGFDGAALRRTRSVLQHKRVDEVMPLLPRTAALGEVARALAFEALRQAPRSARGTGIADAFRVARNAGSDPRLAEAAGRDLLELRSRFAPSGPLGPRPRRGPFLGRERLPDGRRLWALKGPGSEAPVRFFEFGGER